MVQRLRNAVGTRAVLSPLEISAWIVALLLLTVVVSTNQLLAKDSFFFLAHNSSPRTLVLLWILAMGVILLLLTALMIVLRKRASARAFDIVATAITFAAAGFLLGNAFNWVIGLVAGAVFTVAARRIAMGKALLLISLVTAMIPLVGITASADNEFAARVVDFGDEPARPNILWVVPDRAQYQMFFDTSGAVRPEFPNLAELQKSSTTYTRAYSTANGTDLSVPSMLNGVARISEEPRQREAMQRSPGVATWLTPAYDVMVDSPVFVDLCTSPQCSQSRIRGSALGDLGLLTADVAAVAGHTLGPGLASKFPPLDGRWRDFWATSQTGDTAAGPDGQRSTAADAVLGEHERPQFALWHFLGTHDPYNRDFEGRLLFDWPSLSGTWHNNNGSVPSDGAERLARRLYLATAVDFDRQLGALLDQLRTSGKFDQTMVVLTSDHGRAFSRSGDHRVGDDPVMTWNEIAHVPLMVKAPGQTEPAKVTATRSTSQIAKTILGAAGVVVEGGPPLAPELALEPQEGPYIMMDIAADHPGIESLPESLPVRDGWSPEDFSAITAELPFALADPDLSVGEPLPGDWRQFRPSGVEPVAGESSQQLLVLKDADQACPAPSRAAVTLRDALVAQVVRNQTDQDQPEATLGWAIVPQAERAKYTFWCQAG